MSIPQETKRSLAPLQSLLLQISQSEYAQAIEMLHGAGIGKHVRHILDFYNCLLTGMGNGLIDYNRRDRNEIIEQDPQAALSSLNNCIQQIQQFNSDRSLRLVADYSMNEASNQEIDTYLFRELAFNLEHATHHMAIIRMAVEHHFKHIRLDADFGFSTSTIKYRQRISC